MKKTHSKTRAGNPGKSRTHDDVCPIREVLDRVGDKWSVLAVVLLGDGAKRFSELRHTIDGISQRMLTLTLRGLERDGLVVRTVHPTTPPQVEYELSAQGRTLLKPLMELAEWAQRHRAAILSARSRYDTKAARQNRDRSRALTKLR